MKVAPLVPLRTVELVGLRPEARIGYVEVGDHEVPFNMSCVVRKDSAGNKLRFISAKDVQYYVESHSINEVQVAFSPDSETITEVLVP